MRSRARTVMVCVCVCASVGASACTSAPSDGDGGTGSDASAQDAPTSGDAPGDAPTSGDVSVGPLETVHFLGRFDTSDPSGPKFAWPGSGIAAHFTGTGIDVMLADSGTNQFDVIIDGAAPTLLKTSGAMTSYPLAAGLPTGEHDVRIVKRTEGYIGIEQFGGFTPQGGALVATPFPFSRRIEMIGDSITCGYGDIGPGPSSCPFPDNEDEDVAWGMVAAKQLGAMATITAASGRGVYRNGDGTTTSLMPELWLSTLVLSPTPAWDFSKSTPDVVVVNLGTNDFAQGDPGTPYQTAYLAFLQTIRSKYPSAFIVCALGPMLSGATQATQKGYVQNALTALADAKTALLELTPQDGSDGYGCDYHPSQARQATMASALAALVQQKLGW